MAEDTETTVTGKVMSLATKVAIGVATAAITGLLSWTLITVHDQDSEIRLLKYQNNIYNSLFQELYEYHTPGRTAFISSLRYYKMSANSDEVESSDAFAEPKEK